MDGNKKAKTRYAVYYGYHFSRICSTLQIRYSELDKNKIAASNTCTKLHKGFRGDPVEAFTRNKIVGYLQSVADGHPERATQLVSAGFDIEEALLPATYRLTDAACALLTNHTLTATSPFRKDGITRHQVNLLSKGQFAVEKHVLSAARQVIELTDFNGELEDLIQESDDTNMCHPCIYRVNKKPVALLSLMSA